MKMETYNYIRLTLVLSLFSQLSLGDLESYSDYPSHNVSLARRGTTGQRRIFDQSLADAIATVSLNLRASMPLPDFNSRITISAPFYFDFPPVAPAERASADYFGLGDFATGRSLSGGETTRIKMYKELETYVSRIMGADGHSCLLRAMCETGANPHHDDGILGKKDGEEGQGNIPFLRRRHELPHDRQLLRGGLPRLREVLLRGPDRWSGE